MAEIYKPGDVILTPRNDRLIVLDPPRTSRGKLRLRSERSGAIRTTWWGLNGDTWLPPNFKVES